MRFHIRFILLCVLHPVEDSRCSVGVGISLRNRVVKDSRAAGGK